MKILYIKVNGELHQKYQDFGEFYLRFSIKRLF